MGIVSFIISYHQYKKYKLGRNKVKKYSFKYIWETQSQNYVKKCQIQ
jgi:hypothetical protein